MPARNATRNHSEAIRSPRRCTSSGRTWVSSAGYGPSCRRCGASSAVANVAPSLVGVPMTRSRDLSASLRLVLSVMGSLLRGDPDRARHDQADADSPADEPLGHLADPVQGEGATSVRLVLQILDERDQCLL